MRAHGNEAMQAISITDQVSITDQEFHLFQKLIYEIAGISLSPTKKAMVGGRLSRRIRHYALKSYGEYYRMLTGGQEPGELQIAVDLLTTNETHFFREPKHFEFLRQHATRDVKSGQTYRIWSAACSTGEEPYSIAMVLDDCLKDRPWEVVASDLSTRVLDKARTAHYTFERARNMPPQYLGKYCLRGIGPQQGTFLVDKPLRQRVEFMQVNLTAKLPRMGQFDVIFLRNVMIYFNVETKRQVVNAMLPLLRTGAHFIIGHSESLNGVVDTLQLVSPSIYRKP